MAANTKSLLSGDDIGLSVLAVAVGSRFYETLNRDWHQHAYDECHYLLSGSQTYEFAEEPIRQVTLKGGHFLRIQSGRRHRALPDDGTPTTRLSVGWQTDALPSCDNAPFSFDEQLQLRDRFLELPSASRPISPDLQQSILRFLTLMHAPSDALSIRLTGWQLLLDTAQAASRRHRCHHGTLDELSLFLNKNLSARISMDDIARHFGMSRRLLFLNCKKEYGTTPLHLLTLARVNAAKRILKSSPEKSLLDIALDCGFCSASYFTATFRRYAGMVPSQWRSANCHACQKDAQEKVKSSTPSVEARRAV